MRGAAGSRPRSARRSTVEHRDGRSTSAIGGAAAEAPALVLATGGLSIPKLGATSFAYDVARRFGLKIVEPRPALVPLTLAGDQALFKTLSGVSADVVARAGKGEFREAALFTHRGLSGPAILQVSSYWRHGEPVAIDFLPDLPAGWLRQAKRDEPRVTLRRDARAHACPTGWRRRWPTSSRWTASSPTFPTERSKPPSAASPTGDSCPNGSEGFAKAEVTIGGISTAELSSQTMAVETPARPVRDRRGGRRHRLAGRL